MEERYEFRVLLKLAFVDSLPVLMGYTSMGLAAGVLLAAKGGVEWAPLWAMLTATLWVSGTMSFSFVALVATREPIIAMVLLTLMVNFRYAFYGFAMLSRWRDVPFFKKCYLILMMTDENYALELASVIRYKDCYIKYCTVLSALNHIYWIVGVTAGAALVCLLGMMVSPERIRECTNGIEFAMAALFIVILTDQVIAWLAKNKQR